MDQQNPCTHTCQLSREDEQGYTVWQCVECNHTHRDSSSRAPTIKRAIKMVRTPNGAECQLVEYTGDGYVLLFQGRTYFKMRADRVSFV